MTGLVCGPYPGRDGIEYLKEVCRVNLAINLQVENERNRIGVKFDDYSDLITMIRHPIKDVTAPDMSTAARIVSDLLQAKLDGRTVYLHCWGGHGRTGTIVGCLLRQMGMTYMDALSHIEKTRRGSVYLSREPSPQTEEQRACIANFKQLGCMPL